MPTDLPTDEFGLPLPTDWADHEDRWKMSDPHDATFASAVRYLKTRMFKDRDMAPISDIRKFNELAYTLTQYRNQVCTEDPVNMQFLEQNNDHPDVRYKPKRNTHTTTRDVAVGPTYHQQNITAVHEALSNHKFHLEKVVNEVQKQQKSLQEHSAQLQELSLHENHHPSLSKEDLLQILLK